MKDRFDWDYANGHVDPKKFWNIEEIKALPYQRENFNDHAQLMAWEAQGQQARVGALYDMKHEHQPFTTDALIAWAKKQDLEHVGVSYYKMSPGDNLPHHSDAYSKYIELFGLSLRKQSIYRYIFFVESRKPGHVIEVNGRLINWIEGDYAAWRYDIPHMAANLGNDDRYTIQVTGVRRED